MALNMFVVDFIVGNSGLELGIPVHQTLTAVDQALLEQVKEGVANSLGADGVQGEALTAPVAAHTQALQLLGNAGFVFFLPLPDAFHQSVAANVVTGLVFVLEQALFHNSLGCDTGVVRTRNPQSVATSLTAVAYQNILKCVVQGVAQVQGAGHVRRRNDDRERFALTARRKAIFFSPGLVPAGFNF